MNLRNIHPLLASLALVGCTAPAHLRVIGGIPDPEHTAFRILYSVAPELHRERLELGNDCGVSLPRTGSWNRGGDVHAEFRYRDDPEVYTRLLVLRRTVPADGSAPRVSLEICHARKYFAPFKAGGGQERWAIVDRKPYAK
jgi:hypothetical protein